MEMRIHTYIIICAIRLEQWSLYNKQTNKKNIELLSLSRAFVYCCLVNVNGLSSFLPGYVFIFCSSSSFCTSLSF